MSEAEGEPERRKINVKIFLEHMKQKFARMLDLICPDKNTTKDLVTVSEIRPLFELIIDLQTLKDRKVSLVWMDQDSISKYKDPDVPIIIFFVPPTEKYVKLIKQFYDMLKRRGYEKKLFLVYYPKRTMMCKYHMDQEKLLVFFENSTYDFNFDLIPLSGDLLSLEYRPSVTELFTDSEYTCLNLVAESLQRLQMIFGKVPCTIVKGDKAKIAIEILQRLEKEHGNRLSYEEDVREIDAFIVMDRSVDLLTPFVTQLSYQGLLDEFLDIEINRIVIDRSITAQSGEEAPPDGNTKRNFYLTDHVFETIKDLEMTVLGKTLKEKLEEYQHLIKNRDTSSTDLKAIQKLTAEIKKKKFVEPHVNIASHLFGFTKTKGFKSLLEMEQKCLQGWSADEFIEEITMLILKREDIVKIYRLLCIHSLAEGGLKTKHYETIRKEIIETYGFDQLAAFNELSQAGILYNRDTKKVKSTFATLKKTQKLINPDYDKDEPGRKSFPYSAYTPITVRILENIFRQTWANSDLNDKTPGFSHTFGEARNAAGVKSTRKVVVLYMIGGLTYAEISCMRYVAKQHNIELLIASTNIINYKRILEPFLSN